MTIELFILIKSLSPDEKKRFRIFAKNLGSKSSKHIKLFDELNKIGTSQELTAERDEKIRLQTKVGSKNAYAQIKVYLQDALFRFLRDYQTGKNEQDVAPEIIMSNLCEDIQLLLDRKYLQNLLERKLKTAKKFAYKYYFYHDLMKLLQIENFVYRSQEKLEAIQSLEREIAVAYHALLLEHDFISRYNRLYLLERRQEHDFLKQELRRNFEYINNLTVPRFTLRSAMAYYHIKAKYYSLSENNLEQATKNWEEAANFIAADKDVLNAQQERYLNVESNYLDSLVISNTLSLDKVEYAIKNINSITPKSKEIKYKMEQHQCYYWLQYYFGQQQFDKVIAMKDEVSEKVSEKNQYYLKSGRIFIFQYFIAVSLLLQSIKTSSKQQRQLAHDWGMKIKQGGELSYKEKVRNELLLAVLELENDNETAFTHHYNHIKNLLSHHQLSDACQIENEILNGLNRVMKRVKRERKQEIINLHDVLESRWEKYFVEFKIWAQLKITLR